MKTLRWLVVLTIILSSINVIAQETNKSDLARLQSIYMDNLKKLEDKYNTQATNAPSEYDKELNALETSMAKQSNLDGVLAVQKEKERRKTETNLTFNAIVETPKELKALQEKYKNLPQIIFEAHTKEYISLSNTYISYLEKTKASLTQNMRIADALEYKNEIEAIKSLIATMVPKETPKTNVAILIQTNNVVTNQVAMLPVNDKLPVEKVEAVPTNSLVIDLGNNIKIEFAFIPRGEFMMGSPLSEIDRNVGELQHKVKLTRDYWMGIYEITQEQWEKVMSNNPSKSVGAKQPVEQVSWYDCQEFINKLNKRVSEFKIPRTYCFRLPTEAEWEYACRAGTTTRFNTGDEESDLDKAGWMSVHPVGTKQANAWGLYDMHGNVWEWCSDWAGAYNSKNNVNPTGKDKSNCKIRRSGIQSAVFCRSSSRNTSTIPQTKSFDLGFRLVIGVKQ
jgi:formylglycine-generating enzyme required for sulfatase activity